VKKKVPAALCSGQEVLKDLFYSFPHMNRKVPGWVWRRSEASLYSVCTIFMIKLWEEFYYFSGSPDDIGMVIPFTFDL
jgi:hypothetical protein